MKRRSITLTVRHRSEYPDYLLDKLPALKECLHCGGDILPYLEAKLTDGRPGRYYVNHRRYAKRTYCSYACRNRHWWEQKRTRTALSQWRELYPAFEYPYQAPESAQRVYWDMLSCI